MTDWVFHERARELEGELRLLTVRIEKGIKPCHWICTPDGDGGGEWCPDCGYYKVRHLRRHDRKRRGAYLLDGGWPTEDDHTCFCAGCGAILDASLTDYGVEQELDHFRMYGVTPGSAIVAYYVAEVLAQVACTTPEDAWKAEEACTAAEALLWSAT